MAFDLQKILKMSEAPVEEETAATTQEERIVQIPIDELVDFPPELHKFRPATGQRLTDLENSIRENGILNPLLVRKLPDGRHQILAGHNRRTAASNIGYTTVPCIVKNLPGDDDALLVVIADNRSGRGHELLPSELGWSYRQEMDIRRRQGWRVVQTSAPLEQKLTLGQTVPKYNRDLIDDRASGRKVSRYIRLTYLIQPLLDLVDQQKVGLGVGEQLSYLSDRSQATVYNFCYAANPMISLKESQAKALREAEADPDRIVDEDLLEELTAKKPKVRLRTVKIEMTRLREYFPAGTPEEVVIQTILTSLSHYFEMKEDS